MSGRTLEELADAARAARQTGWPFGAELLASADTRRVPIAPSADGLPRRYGEHSHAGGIWLPRQQGHQLSAVEEFGEAAGEPSTPGVGVSNSVLKASRSEATTAASADVARRRRWLPVSFMAPPAATPPPLAHYAVPPLPATPRAQRTTLLQFRHARRVEGPLRCISRLDLPSARAAARLTGLQLLATMQAELGDLDRVERPRLNRRKLDLRERCSPTASRGAVT